MITFRHLFAIVCFSALSSAVFAQQLLKGIVVAKENNETLVGASVIIVGTTIGSMTDIDGAFEIPNVKIGKNKVACSYIGFNADTIEVEVTADMPKEVGFSLVDASAVLSEVVISTKVNRESSSAMTMLIQKSPSIVTGLSKEDMKRSPDRSAGDALKRVSGTSIQDNKFVVIRGLNDRYNIAMVNGYVLPSTETDRRAFSFDLFPANLLDNMLVYKSALPDLPGEFAGGVVVMNTREIPSQNFFQINIGTGYNTQSTNQAYKFGSTGKTDWLGIDDGSRAIPAGLGDYEAFKKNESSSATRFEQSQLFGNDWGITSYEKMQAPINFQLSGARRFKINDVQNIGLIGALTYSNSPRIIKNDSRNNYIRNVIDGKTYIDTSYTFNDVAYRFGTNLGGLLNFTYELDAQNRIMFNNVYNVSSDNSLVERSGWDSSQDAYTKATSQGFTSTTLLSNQLRGEHNVTGLKLNWNIFSNRIGIATPSLRNLLYTVPKNETDVPYRAQISPAASLTSGGRLYSDQNENNQGINLDISIPYSALKQKNNNLKLGAFVTSTSRDFNVRWFGYAANPASMEAQALALLPQDSIFAVQNIKSGGFWLKEGTTPADNYTAASLLPGVFAMIDQKISQNLRLTGGVRVEYFSQSLATEDVGGTQVGVDTSYLNVLPSVILAYSLSEKSKLRASVSQTVSRPTFRELSPFSVYNFDLNTAVVGDPNLRAATINNADLRYEVFPSANQMFAFGAFYKYFKNPIEQTTRINDISFENATDATNYGVEAEFRYKPIQQLTLFGNLAYIRSRIQLDSSVSQGNRNVRELQGQSPYLLNAGINYQIYEKGLDATLLVNRIGRRIAQVGTGNFLDVYEAPRTVLDFSVSKRLFKNGEIKLTVADILNRPLVYYHDQNSNGKFDTAIDSNGATDTVFQRFRFGTTYSISLSYKF